MDSERELLEWAAKAAGLAIHWPRQSERDEEGYGNSGLWIVNGSTCWNPLTDDGDALRLAVKLRLDVDGEHDPIFVGHSGLNIGVREPTGADFAAATRRAIVRAAAAIGRAQP